MSVTGQQPSKVNYTTPDSLFTLPPELVELKQLARDIVNRECIPLESKFLANNPEWPRGGGKGGISVETLVFSPADNLWQLSGTLYAGN